MQAVKPMLADTAAEPFDSPNHIFEWKWNGIRIVGRKQGESALLQGRSGADFTAQFPEFAELHKHILVGGADIDGEIVCLGEDGLPDFNRVQNRFAKTDPLDIQVARQQFPATFMVFDVLRVDDYDLTAGGRAQATLMQRKEILQKILVPDGRIKLSSWVETNGIALHQKAAELDQEGVMAKTKSGLYSPGGRNKDWLKMKVPKYAKFVICGYTKGTGWRSDTMGAIVLGAPATGGYRWVGNAGTGFKQAVLEDVFKSLQTIRTEDSPFPAGTKVPDLASWVRPILVAEVKYYDTTKAGQLVWPVFQRVATEITPEDLISPENGRATWQPLLAK
jgi:bifunctional non-homologous end joining protein LigD